MKDVKKYKNRWTAEIEVRPKGHMLLTYIYIREKGQEKKEKVILSMEKRI